MTESDDKNFPSFSSKLWLPQELEDKLEHIRRCVKAVDEHAKTCATSMKYFTSHDSRHFAQVEKNLGKLLPADTAANLHPYERFFLLGGAWLHDVGMCAESILDKELGADEVRSNHHIYSEKFIVERYKKLGVEENSVYIFGLLARYHRRKEDIMVCNQTIWFDGAYIRLRLLAAYLRLADALCIDMSRVPDPDYAIVMTYDLPAESKVHWIRSKLVDSFYIDSINGLIHVVINLPNNLKEILPDNSVAASQDEEFTSWLKEWCEISILQELRSELNSVKDVFLRNNITRFIDFELHYNSVHMRKRLVQQLWDVVRAEILFHGPSSSLIHNAVLTTIEYIIESKTQNSQCLKMEQDETKDSDLRQTLEKFIDRMTESTARVRRCHFGLLKTLKKYKILLKTEDPNVLKEALNFATHYDFSTHFSTTFIKEFKELDQTREDLEKLLDNNGRKISFMYFINIYTKMLILASKIDKKLVRKWSSDFFRNTDTTNASYNAVASPPNAGEVQRAYNFQEIIDRIVDLVLYELFPDEFTKPLIVQIPERLGILLYGYSAYAIRGLMGFRDYIQEQVLEKIKEKQGLWALFVRQLLRPRGRSNLLEITISNYFDLFVCEGQPKNVYDVEFTQYHDGLKYEEKLKKRGFTCISIIPDADVGTLLTAYYHFDSLAPKLPSEPNPTLPCYPLINFVLLGANGFSEKYVYHSAGHLSTIYAALQKARTTTLIFAQTTKFMPENDVPHNTYPCSRAIPYGPHKIAIEGNWKRFMVHNREHVRKNNFLHYEKSYAVRAPIQIYTPLEDKISFFEFDYFISERGLVNTFATAKEICLKLLKNEQDADNLVECAKALLCSPARGMGPKILLDRRYQQILSTNEYEKKIRKIFETIYMNLGLIATEGETEDILNKIKDHINNDPA